MILRRLARRLSCGIALCLGVYTSMIHAQIQTRALSEAEQGLRIMANRLQGNCVTCHQVSVLRDAKGIDGAAGKQGNFGPSLDGVAKRYNVAQLRQWVVDARKLSVNTWMPPFGTLEGTSQANPARPMLSPEEIDKVTAALASLRNSESDIKREPALALPAQTQLSGHQFLSPQLQALQQDADANPISLWIEKGQRVWRGNCQSCHQAPESLSSAVAKHPHLVTRDNRTSLVNLEDQINVCRQRSGQNPKGLEDEDTLSLSALLHNAAKGQMIQVKAPADPKTQRQWDAELAQGAQLYATRMGRLNLACVHCHDNNVGATLRAEVVSPGHPTGFPIYRLNWQNMGSIDRRLRACYSGVQASLPLPGSPPLRQLELYLKVRANGMPIDGPSIRR